MQISWHGGFTIKIAAKEATIVINPYEPNQSGTAFRAKADIVALTHPDNKEMSNVKGITDASVIINTPGEYSLRGTTLDALGWHDQDGSEQLLLRWEIEGMNCVYLGALNRAVTDKELSRLSQVNTDILILPVGGGSALNTKEALKTVSEFEPRMVIPINYKVPKWKEKLEAVDQFKKELGVKDTKPEKKVIVRANKLPQDDMQTVILEP